MNILLASQSPRRRSLIQYLNIPFDVCSPNVDEQKISQELFQQLNFQNDFYQSAEEFVQALAVAKSNASIDANTWKHYSHVIAADTIVLLNKKILGKPRDEMEAQEMLEHLSGHRHRVCTGVSIETAKSKQNFCVSADVEFYPLDNTMRRMIEEYVASGVCMDKAGSYGIQDKGALFVRAIYGDVHTVIGFPIAEIARRL